MSDGLSLLSCMSRGIASGDWCIRPAFPPAAWLARPPAAARKEPGTQWREPLPVRSARPWRRGPAAPSEGAARGPSRGRGPARGGGRGRGAQLGCAELPLERLRARLQLRELPPLGLPLPPQGGGAVLRLGAHDRVVRLLHQDLGRGARGRGARVVTERLEVVGKGLRRPGVTGGALAARELEEEALLGRIKPEKLGKKNRMSQSQRASTRRLLRGRAPGGIIS